MLMFAMGQMGRVLLRKVCLGGVLALLALVEGHAQPAVPVGSFHTVLASSALMVAARVVPFEGELPRYALAEARLAEPMLDGLRLASEWLVVVDCGATPRQVAPVRQLRNAQLGGEPAQWVEVAGSRALPMPTDWGRLPFTPVLPTDAQPLQRLQLPGVWQVVSQYACAQVEKGGKGLVSPEFADAARVQRASLESDAALLASQVGRDAGLPDVQTWRCPLTDRVGHRVGELELAFSPSAGAVRVNDKWVSDGVLDTRYVGFELDGISFRFMLEAGVLRMVRRDEMQSVASARCVLVLPRKTVKSGW